MNTVPIDGFTEFAKGINFTIPTEQATNLVMAMNPNVLIAGIILIVLSVVVLFLLKKFIEHAIIGAISCAIAIFIFNIQLPLIPSFVISIIIGPAGLGAMLLLKFMGII